MYFIFKGFNTGVVLFDLERMRQSAEYNKYLKAEEVARVMNKYGYHVTLGDQDWFTNIGFEVSALMIMMVKVDISFSLGAIGAKVTKERLISVKFWL